MQSYARVVAGHVVEVFTPPSDTEIDDCFHPSVAGQFVHCPSEVVPGWSFDGATFAPPAPIAPEA